MARRASRSDSAQRRNPGPQDECGGIEDNDAFIRDMLPVLPATSG
jgi:hypothetical protein